MRGVQGAYVWSEELLRYRFGPGHPMDPVRLELTRALIVELGLPLDVLPAPVATDRELEQVHGAQYVADVRRSAAAAVPYALGLTDEHGDNPVFPDLHQAAARIAGGTRAGLRAVRSGAPPRVLAFAGGMHHAMPERAAGFCIFNDAALAIADSLADGASRVLYVDVDVHHGDGVQACFAADPRVITISVHQHPHSLFPHTGFPSEIGVGQGIGHALNVALPVEVTDGQWLRAIDAVVEPVAREWRPEVVVSQHGADTHAADPLGGLEISIEAQREAAILMRGYADEYASGRWLALGGGGYDVLGAVPVVWAHVAAVVAGVDLPTTTPLPPGFAARLGELGAAARPFLGDTGAAVRWRPFAAGWDPGDAVDRAVMATRQAAFAHLGLDPLTA